MTTQVNVNLTWLQRRKLPHHPYVGQSVSVRINGDMDAWKWRRDVYLTGPAADIAIVLIYINHKDVDYSLLRPRTKVMPLPPMVAIMVVLTVSGPEAMAGNYEFDSFSINRSRTDNTTEMSGGYGTKTWSYMPSNVWDRNMNADVGVFGDFMHSVAAGAERVGGWFSQGWDTPGATCCGDWADNSPSGPSGGMRSEPGPSGY